MYVYAFNTDVGSEDPDAPLSEVERQFDRGLKRLLLCRQGRLGSKGSLGSQDVMGSSTLVYPCDGFQRAFVRLWPVRAMLCTV